MNAVSFCLYGDVTRYADGLLDNLRQMPVIYPGWQALVYTDGAHGENYLQECRALGAQVLLREPQKESGGMFWRLEAVDDPAWEAVIVRDADSLINWREQAAVAAWLASPALLHVMHDFHYHWSGPWPVQGCAWGAKRGAFPYDFPRLSRWWLANKGPHPYNADQAFLLRYVWPYVVRDGMVHTKNVNSRHRGLPFPAHRPVDWHVGERMSDYRRRLQTQKSGSSPPPAKPKPPPLRHGFAA